MEVINRLVKLDIWENWEKKIFSFRAVVVSVM